MVPEGWREAKIKELSGANDRPVTKLGPFGSSLKKSDYTTAGYKVYGQQQVLANDENFGDYWIGEKKFKQLRACEVAPGDILLSTMGSFGSALRLTDQCAPGIINPRLLRLSISPRIACPRFLEAFFKSSLAERQFKSFAQGGTMPAVNGASIGGLKIPLPPLPEQRKIADILSTWDAAIEKTEALMATARTQKRALMQSLLTGKRRFSEFEGQPWKEVRLGDVCEIHKGAQKSKNTLYATGAYPVINGGVSPSGYSDEWNTEAGTITISEGGNSCGFANLMEVRFWSGGHCYTLKALKVNRDFLFHWLKFREAEIMRLRVGSGLPNIQKKAISAFPVSVPALEEQVKIAEAISCALKEESLLVCKVDQLRTEKKALMQQLLTGKRRVVV